MPFLRPDLDDLDGNWVDQAGGTDLFAALDEAVTDDADFIRSGDNPTADISRVRLSDPTGGGVDTASPVTVRYRYRKQGAGTMNLTVRLKEGVTARAEWTHNGITDTYVTAAQVLSPAEKSAVVDWNNLFLEFEAGSALTYEPVFSDDFNRADELLEASADYTLSNRTNGGRVWIVGNKVEMDSETATNAFRSYHYIEPTRLGGVNNDQYGELTWHGATSNAVNFTGIGLRCQDTTTRMQGFLFAIAYDTAAPAGWRLRISYEAGSSFEQLALHTLTAQPPAGARIRARISGSNLAMDYAENGVDWTEGIITAVDARYPTGHIMLNNSYSTPSAQHISWDNLVVGNYNP